MPETPSKDHTFSAVQKAIAGSLYLDSADEVKGHMRLGPDLGVESIDTLDIAFK